MGLGIENNQNLKEDTEKKKKTYLGCSQNYRFACYEEDDDDSSSYKVARQIQRRERQGWR